MAVRPFVFSCQAWAKVHPKASIVHEKCSAVCCIFTTDLRQNYTTCLAHLSIGRFPNCCNLGFVSRSEPGKAWRFVNRGNHLCCLDVGCLTLLTYQPKPLGAENVAIKKIRIYDMDGNIVCSMHRYRTVKDTTGRERIDLQYWRDNEYRAMDDSLLPLAETYKKDLQCSETFVIIATARVMNGPDWQFVREILGEPDHFISRAPNDTRSGGLLKVLGLRKIFNLKQFQGVDDVIFYEDNIDYLKTVCDEFGIQGVYTPSKQGH